MIVKRILCLANSRKMGGHCVAGREVLDAGPGPWIRPVSTRPSEEVSEWEIRYQDWSNPEVLDIIDIPLIRHKPNACQTENWLLDPNRRWTKVGRASWDDLQQYVEDPATLWINGHSTRNGFNDRIPQDDADTLPNSLVLIRVPDLKLKVFAPDVTHRERPRVQADFCHRGIRYALWVTDPRVEKYFETLSAVTYKVGECCLCVSLGEPFDGYRYKLVAAVIPRHRTPPKRDILLFGFGRRCNG